MTKTNTEQQKIIRVVISFVVVLAASCKQDISTIGETEIQQISKDDNVSANCAGSNSETAKLRTVSIVPQFSASRIQTDYWPLLTEIGSRTNICFKLIHQESIPLFEKDLKAGKVDYAFMNPYHQVMVKKIYQPIIRDKKRLLKGIIVINKQNKMSSIEQLDGNILLLPAPNAFAASLLTRAYLNQKNIAFEAKYVKTHQNVYRGVARNPKYIGGGVNNTLKRESEELKSNLKILFQTKGYPAHPFSANSNLTPEEIQNVQSSWLEIAEEPKLRSLFDAIQIKKPIVADYERDYAQLTKLGLEEYVQ